MLTSLGLSLNFIGSVVLLGSDVQPVKQALERVDPVHRVYLRGLNKIVDKSIDEDQLGQKQHPYDGPVSPNDWSWWALRRFLERHAEQGIPRDADVNVSGGWFKINGSRLTFPEDRMVQMNENEQLHTGTLSLSTAFGLLYEARMKRVYIYGVLLLALGFLLQLIDSLSLLATVSGCL